MENIPDFLQKKSLPNGLNCPHNYNMHDKCKSNVVNILMSNYFANFTPRLSTISKMKIKSITASGETSTFIVAPIRLT